MPFRHLLLASLLVLACLLALPSALLATDGPIDRQALATRHTPHTTAVDPLASLSLGNGRFAMTVDVTGLQSFPAIYEKGVSLGTLSDWGWHSFPNTEGYQLSDTFEAFDTHGRPVNYPTLQNHPASQYLRANPHRLGLGQLGLEFTRADGSLATIDDLKNIDQRLDLWSGILTSRYTIENAPVTVETVCHPELDLISVRVESPLVAAGRIKGTAAFAYGNGAWGTLPEDWTQPDKHQTSILSQSPDSLRLHRTLDNDQYFVDLRSTSSANFALSPPHRVEITPGAGNPTLEFSIHFTPTQAAAPANLTHLATTAASARHWADFWGSGGAIDFSACTDPRAFELERRVVLSQYLTAIQCRSDIPPQETGLTFNSWYGKPHLEMHWWHGVHWALWSRLESLERTLPWYQSILPESRSLAADQGYAGARWPKMVGPQGGQGPSTIAPLLIWQQPHPLYYAELVYRQRPERATLEAYSDIVFATADFMASYAHRDPASGTYTLGPPLIPAQESYNPRLTSNPPFEMAYWRWGLATAQAWRERLGLARDDTWDAVLASFAPYPHHEDAYATAQGMWNTIDHPSVLGAYGFIAGQDIDPERMRRTLHRVMAEYDWHHTWGWDYPLVAFTAARLGEPELAIDALLLDVQKNRYLPNGHNYQDERLRLYLPGNGGLLTAVAMMAAGWDGAPDLPAPGFPKNGQWNIRHESLLPMP